MKEQIEIDDLKFNIRSETFDEHTVRYVLKNHTYFKHLDIKEGDKILDIGMNIGTFSVTASKAGADVTGFEPNPENYNLALENISLNNVKVKTYNQAVSNRNGRGWLWLNNNNRGNHSLKYFRGREKISVEVKDIKDILRKNSFNKIKMDCEGEELNIIRTVRDWKSIKIIRLEYHRSLLKDHNNFKLDEMIRKLEADGFEVIGSRKSKWRDQMLTAIRKDIHEERTD